MIVSFDQLHSSLLNKVFFYHIINVYTATLINLMDPSLIQLLCFFFNPTDPKLLKADVNVPSKAIHFLDTFDQLNASLQNKK